MLYPRPASCCFVMLLCHVLNVAEMSFELVRFVIIMLFCNRGAKGIPQMMAMAFSTRVKGGMSAVFSHAKGSMRTVVSVIVAAALVMPAFSLSQLAPAYADTGDAADQQAAVSPAERTSSQSNQINVKVPITGVTVDADGQVVDAPLSSADYIHEDVKLQTQEEVTAGEIVTMRTKRKFKRLLRKPPPMGHSSMPTFPTSASSPPTTGLTTAGRGIAFSTTRTRKDNP